MRLSVILLVLCILFTGCQKNADTGSHDNASIAGGSGSSLESSTEPNIEPSAKPIIEPSAKPIIEPSAKPIIEPSAKPIIDSSSESNPAVEKNRELSEDITIPTKSNSDSKISLIKLNLGKTEKIMGGELLYINDYKLSIPEELVKIGYDTKLENNVLTITAKDNSYKFVLLQLTDNYIQIKEKDVDSFYESEEYAKWEEEYYATEDMDDEAYTYFANRLDEITTKYYKGLGYNAQNTPNSILTQKELNDIIGKYLPNDNDMSSGSNGLFPGYQYYDTYDWGKREAYAIPKIDPDDSSRTSEFSVYLEMFHYYDRSKINFSIDLWRW